MCSNDPFENTLTAPKRNIFSIDNRAAEYARLMGASKEAMCVDKEENEESILKVDRYLSDSVDRHHLASDSWGSEKVPKVELKQLLRGIKYAFLYDKSYPVIVHANLTSGELTLLLNKLHNYHNAIGYTFNDIPGISPDLCMHRIHVEDESKSSIEHQKRLNPNLKEVVKKEIMELLDAGIIYPISNSNWVSTVHVVPKKEKLQW